MKRARGLFRRIKAALGMGLTWALGWAVGFAIIFAVVPYLVGAAAGWWPPVSWFLVGVGMSGAMGGIAGFIAGTSFSVVLGVAERRHTFAELSIARFAAWGAVGGIVLAAVISLITSTNFESVLGVPTWLHAGVAWGSLGAASAAGSLVMARRAGARSALDSGERAGVIRGDMMGGES